MDYRVATVDDIPQLGRMRWDFRAEDGEAPIEDFDTFESRYAAFVRSGMKSHTWLYWVAVDDDQIISHAAVNIVHGVPRPCRESDQWGYVTDCYTRPEYRGRGVGTQLLSALKEWAADTDLELLLVWPSDRARSFYERAGFAPAEDVAQLTLRSYS